MKIQDAWVDDPATRGILERPKLCVQVDELPDVTIPDQTFSGGWTVGKYGPFVRFFSATDIVDAGDFNVRFRNHFPSVVDISLFLERGDDYFEGYSLNLTRGRQLLRKWDSGWRLLIADKEAQSGRIVWHPVEQNPHCKFFNPELRELCGYHRIAGIARMSNIELPYCSNHLREYNNKHAARRASASR